MRCLVLGEADKGFIIDSWVNPQAVMTGSEVSTQRERTVAQYSSISCIHPAT